jgi:integrase
MAAPVAGETPRTRRDRIVSAGIVIRHGRDCLAREGGRCRCRPGYQAWIYSAREGRKVRRTFGTLAAARAWRAEAIIALRKGTMRAAPTPTLREAGEAWLAGARDGSVRNRSGDVYKPSALRGYEAALRTRILPDLGGARLSEITRADVQSLVDRLLAQGLDASTLRNAVMPLRVIFRRAIARGEVPFNPTTGLELPAVRGSRERIATPEEAAALLRALDDGDRAVWATAIYAGLRRGELMAVRWENVDLAAGVISVERSWDPKDRSLVGAKTRAGRRRVPIGSALRGVLVEHGLRQGRRSGLVFGRTVDKPFSYEALLQRAKRRWRAAALVPIGLHECRHTFASLMIGAGVNAKALSSYMGHASIQITFDRYGHLMPGNEDEAAGLLDAYLTRATRAGSVTSLA